MALTLIKTAYASENVPSRQGQNLNQKMEELDENSKTQIN